MKKIFWWIAGGIFFTAGAFFIPAQTASIWPSVIWANVAALVYMSVFMWVWLPRVESNVKRRAIAGTLGLLAVFSVASAAISYEGTQRQLDILPEIRRTIDSSIAKHSIQEPLLETLRAYHRGANGKSDVGNVFVQKFDSLITDDSLFVSKTVESNELLTIYFAKADADSVILIAESGYIDGKNARYKNFSGAKGRYQTRGILTSKGVYYERTN